MTLEAIGYTNSAFLGLFRLIPAYSVNLDLDFGKYDIEINWLHEFGLFRPIPAYSGSLHWPPAFIVRAARHSTKRRRGRGLSGDARRKFAMRVVGMIARLCQCGIEPLQADQLVHSSPSRQ